MTQRRLSCLILFPLLFFSCPILSSPSSLRTSKVKVNSTITEVERIIKSLNLFPSSAINSGDPSFRRLPDAMSSSLVEQQFRLPALGDPGTSIRNLGHYAGYYRLPHSRDARMFYYFFESRRGLRNDPVVIWLNGGPGASSSIGLFYENGPYQIINHSLIWNDFGWDQVSNIIYIDQPTGTGFSYSSDHSDIRTDQESVSNDLYDFLQVFFHQHPQYLRNDLYITGESYAGHYIPALATRIRNGNNNGDGDHINLKGIAIGNGLTHPVIQYKSLTDYASNMRLITETEVRRVVRLIPKCEEDAARCNSRIGGVGGSCMEAYSSCTAVFNRLLEYYGSNRNYYDIRKERVGGMCYDFSYMENMLNNATIRTSIGVGNIRFVSLSVTIFNAMINDWMRNHAVEIPALLEDGIKVLIYAGEYDLIVNWIGIYRWVTEMNWSGQRTFNDKDLVSYVVDHAMKGELKEYGPLTFLKVHDSGHMVPMDQPKAALKMLERWTQGGTLMSRE
ncbi:serine carboxypeptidase-like [Impatiens glandulifera]|uniref:serine carboxypeptidase-like n=1 Tax=Impatiens glandulifera TaxID=253017 RepID=UPI001FB0A59C|nr:serine carboxypeptidase-like [Impatiens glandulifera]